HRRRDVHLHQLRRGTLPGGGDREPRQFHGRARRQRESRERHRAAQADRHRGGPDHRRPRHRKANHPRCARRSCQVSSCAYATGSRKNVTTCALIAPPITAAASGWYSAPPEPHPNTSGSTPKIVVNDVIVIARRRCRPPSNTASWIECPSSRKRRMASSFTTASLSAMPIITTMPINDTALMLWPVIHSSTKPPAAASGTVIITTSGIVNDANSPASTRNTSATERIATSASCSVVRCCSTSAPVTSHVSPAGGVSSASCACTSALA